MSAQLIVLLVLLTAFASLLVYHGLDSLLREISRQRAQRRLRSWREEAFLAQARAVARQLLRDDVQ